MMGADLSQHRHLLPITSPNQIPPGPTYQQPRPNGPPPAFVPKIVIPQKSPQKAPTPQKSPTPQKAPTKQWINLKSKIFNEDPNLWYNLLTGRFVKNKPKDKPDATPTEIIAYSLRGIRILGSIQHVIDFWKLNIAQLGLIYPQGTKFEDVFYQPFEDITFLSEDAARRTQVCQIDSAGTVIPAAKSTDVEQLTETQINQMCPFSFAGMFSKVRITDVIDGDTIHGIIYVPLLELGAARALGSAGSPRVGIIPQGNFKQTGFFATVKIRLYGYDAAEKDTENGKIAKQLFTDKIASLGNIVWCQFIEVNVAQEKYDRILGVIFEDQQRTKLLNNYLLRKEKELNIRMVNPYMGGTKQTF